MEFSDHALWYLRAAGPIAGGALLWLTYFDLKDGLRPEPRRALVLGFVLGIAAVAIAAGFYAAAPWLGLPAAPGDRPVDRLLYCLLIVGPFEEFAKFLLAALVLFRLHWFDEVIDGLLYASTVSIGFAAVENFAYAPSLSWWEQLARAIASPLIHCLFSAVWGITSGYAILHPGPIWRRAALMIAGVVVASLLHGLYDAALLSLDAPWLASLLALSIWVGVIVYARDAVRLRRR